MLTALVNDILRDPTQAIGFDRAACPGCGAEVYAKRPDYMTHHWAHMPGAHHCDYAGESEWHMAWKMRFADVGQLEHTKPTAPRLPAGPTIPGRLCSYHFEMPDQCKIEIPAGVLWCDKHQTSPVVAAEVAHRTDVWTTVCGSSSPGRAFEFQSKAIDIDDMAARNRYWGNVVWVLDGRDLGIVRVQGRPSDSDFDMYSMSSFDLYSWDRIPRMVSTGINPWIPGMGSTIYVDLGNGLMFQVLRVDFPSTVVGETISVGAFLDLYLADAMSVEAPESDRAGREITPNPHYAEALDRSQRQYEAMMASRSVKIGL